ANADLTISLPDGAVPISVLRDDTEVPFEQGGPRVWLPLPGGSRACVLKLRWRYGEDAEAFLQPRLDEPHLDGAVAGPTVWTCNVPVGLQVQSRSLDPLGRGKLDLRRAEAQERLSALLAEAAPPNASSSNSQLANAQAAFYRYCRVAECEIVNVMNCNRTFKA